MGEEACTIPKCEGISPLDQALSSPNFSYYEHLRALLCSYLPETAIALIDRTFYVADVAHREQKELLANLISSILSLLLLSSLRCILMLNQYKQHCSMM